MKAIEQYNKLAKELESISASSLALEKENTAKNNELYSDLTKTIKTLIPDSVEEYFNGLYKSIIGDKLNTKNVYVVNSYMLEANEEYFNGLYKSIIGDKLNTKNVYVVNSYMLEANEDKVKQHREANPNLTDDEVVNLIAPKKRVWHNYYSRYSGSDSYSDKPIPNCSYYYADKDGLGVAWNGGKGEKKTKCPLNQKVFGLLNKQFLPLIEDKRKAEALNKMIDARNLFFNSILGIQKVNTEIPVSITLTGYPKAILSNSRSYKSFTVIADEEKYLVTKICLTKQYQNIKEVMWNGIGKVSMECPAKLDGAILRVYIEYKKVGSNSNDSSNLGYVNQSGFESDMHDMRNVIVEGLGPIFEIIKSKIGIPLKPYSDFIGELKAIKEEYADLIFFSMD